MDEIDRDIEKRVRRIYDVRQQEWFSRLEMGTILKELDAARKERDAEEKTRIGVTDKIAQLRLYLSEHHGDEYRGSPISSCEIAIQVMKRLEKVRKDRDEKSRIADLNNKLISELVDERDELQTELEVEKRQVTAMLELDDRRLNERRRLRAENARLEAAVSELTDCDKDCEKLLQRDKVEKELVAANRGLLLLSEAVSGVSQLTVDPVFDLQETLDQIRDLKVDLKAAQKELVIEQERTAHSRAENELAAKSIDELSEEASRLRKDNARLKKDAYCECGRVYIRRCYVCDNDE